MESLRKTPPNLYDLPEDLRVEAEEMLYRSQLRNVHGLGPDSPLLKSRDKIKDMEK